MINKTKWNGYHITYVSDCGFDVLQKFKEFFEKIQKNETGDWKLVGYHDIPETAGPEFTWIIPDVIKNTSAKQGWGVIFKKECRKKEAVEYRACMARFLRTRRSTDNTD